MELNCITVLARSYFRPIVGIVALIANNIMAFFYLMDLKTIPTNENSYLAQEKIRKTLLYTDF